MDELLFFPDLSYVESVLIKAGIRVVQYPLKMATDSGVNSRERLQSAAVAERDNPDDSDSIVHQGHKWSWKKSFNYELSFSLR
jgi:hypothetical protein